MRTRGQRAADLADDALDFLARPRRWRRCSSGAVWPRADAGRKTRRAADSSSSRSSRGRSALPGGRAAGRRSHRDRGRSAWAGWRERRGTARRRAARSPPGRARSCDSASARGLPNSSRLSVDLASHRRTVLAPRRELAGQHRHHRIMAQLVVIDQVLVAQRDTEDALANQRHHRVLDQFRRAAVGEAAGEAIDQPDRTVGRPEQQGAGIRGDRRRRQTRPSPTTFDACKLEQLGATLCRHRGVLRRSQVVVAQQLSLTQSPDAPPQREKCGLEPPNARKPLILMVQPPRLERGTPRSTIWSA